MVGIERNKDPELPKKQRNTSWFVLLDDRKHGRAGKFPVFYDTDTGDYLEPPEGFLDSSFETLKEWYAAHPEDDPKGENYKESTHGDVLPLSEENRDRSLSDVESEDIPPQDVPLDAGNEEVKDGFLEEQPEPTDAPATPPEDGGFGSDEPPF